MAEPFDYEGRVFAAKRVGGIIAADGWSIKAVIVGKTWVMNEKTVRAIAKLAEVGKPVGRETR